MSRSSAIFTFVPVALLLTAFAACFALPSGFPSGASLLVRPASLDVANVHLPAVMVSPSVADLREGRPRGACSGALINSRIVVTAAHCFCNPRALAPQDELPPVKSRRPVGPTVMTRARALQDAIATEITDKSSSCAQHANISTLVYEPSSESGEEPSERRTHRRGRVLIHPDFEMIVARRHGRKEIVWNNADLAVVVLEKPVRMDFEPVVLPDFEVKVGDAFVIVGYGLGEDSAEDYGSRQFGDSRVAGLFNLETGSVVFVATDSPGPDGKAPSHAGVGDSGGAVVRKDNPNILIGIISMGANTPGGTKLSLFTSIYPERQWLLEIIRQVDLQADAGVNVPDAGAAPSPMPDTR